MDEQKSSKQFQVDFIGIGAAKSGTTWLAECLRQHPDVALSEPKEVNFFNKLAPEADISLFNKGVSPCYNKNFGKSLSWYANHFRHAKPHQIKGEFSVIYFCDKEAPFHIKRYYPNAKLLLCLRNPIDRAYSHYWMYRSYFNAEHRTFDESVRDKDNNYVKNGFYADQLEHYLNFFNKDQIHIVLFDDIKKDPVGVFKKTCSFLGLREDINTDFLFKKSNASKVARTTKLLIITDKCTRFLVQMRLSFVLNFLRNLGFKKLFMKVASTPFKYPEMSPETRAYLQERFQPDIKKMEEHLGRDLSMWK